MGTGLLWRRLGSVVVILVLIIAPLQVSFAEEASSPTDSGSDEDSGIHTESNHDSLAGDEESHDENEEEKSGKWVDEKDSGQNEVSDDEEIGEKIDDEEWKESDEEDGQGDNHKKEEGSEEEEKGNGENDDEENNIEGEENSAEEITMTGESEGETENAEEPPVLDEEPNKEATDTEADEVTQEVNTDEGLAEEEVSADETSTAEIESDETILPEISSTTTISEAVPSEEASSSSSSTVATNETTATTSKTSDAEELNENLDEHSENVNQSPNIENSTTSESSIELVGTSTLGTVATTSDDTFEGRATGTPTIVTGDSIALANVLNLVNTNIVNSDGVILFDNFFETLFEDFDLREAFNSIEEFGCSLIACSSADLITNISNDAQIKNALLIQALTGRNTIEGGATSTISTGDAYAGLNLVNVANTNIIDSNYLLVTLNAFKDVNGDIIFPSLSTFFNTLAGGASPDAINIMNSANVVNNVNLNGQTGNNLANDNGSSLIQTGNSGAAANIFNQLNTSLVGGQSLSILFRVHGNWAGEIFGAPSDLTWMEDGQGGIYLFDTGSGGAFRADNLALNSTNTASILNDVSVVALTGENNISGAETALISTGNAYAGANIVNVANATVVGRNWILAVINIMGDFNGNIAFGRPDLWVGAQAELPNSVEDGKTVTYKLTAINNGDSPASNVVLTDDYDERYVEILSASVPWKTLGSGKIVWDIGSLDPGTATEITYDALIKNTGYRTDITNTVALTEKETDNNKLDNLDTITVTTDGPRRSGGRRSDLMHTKVASVEALEVARTTASTTIEGENRNVHQEIIVKNTSGESVRGVSVHDVLTDPYGNLIKDEVWELGEIFPNEEIVIGYNIFFGENAEHGVYRLATSLFDGSMNVVKKENGVVFLRDHMISSPTPAFSLMKRAPLSTSTLSVGGVEIAEDDEHDSKLDLPVLPFVSIARADEDHGLPMTHVPFRYSIMLFIAAILVSKFYLMYRTQRQPRSSRMRTRFTLF
jgi:hypothetical protein